MSGGAIKQTAAGPSEALIQAGDNKFKSGPWTDLGLTLPIFVGYHLGVVFLPMRNAADFVTTELVALADRSLPLYGALTLAIGAVYVITLVVLGRGRALHWNRFVTIALEGIVYAIAMRIVAAYVVGRLTMGGWTLAESALVGSPLEGRTLGDRFAGLIMSLGAGFYEEVAFRVIGYGLGAKLLLVLFPAPVPFKKVLTYAGWAFFLAIAFSAWHYIGPHGDPWNLRSFLFRAVCGLVFTVIYQFRGFAPAVWTHALYDIWVLVL